MTMTSGNCFLMRKYCWRSGVIECNYGARASGVNTKLLGVAATKRSGPFNAVQLEAMAAGKPVVSCDVGTGMAWVNQNEVTGLVVLPRDPDAF